MPITIYSHPDCDNHVTPPGHPERVDRLPAVLEALAPIEANRVDAPLAEDGPILRVHPAAYLDRFKALSDAGGGELGERTPFGPGGYEIAALSAGLVTQALRGVLTGRWSNAYALSRPPGHHCLPDHPMGFCLLANIAIAARAMRAEGRLGRLAVVDWDVHHGNGTEAIFADDPDTLTISLHQEGNYPWATGGVETDAQANVNIPLPPGTGHAAYLAAFDQIVRPARPPFSISSKR